MRKIDRMLTEVKRSRKKEPPDLSVMSVEELEEIVYLATVDGNESSERLMAILDKYDLRPEDFG